MVPVSVANRFEPSVVAVVAVVVLVVEKPQVAEYAVATGGGCLQVDVGFVGTKAVRLVVGAVQLGPAEPEGRAVVQRELFAEGLEAGGNGCLMGRNVTKSPDPERMIEQLCGIAHHGWSVDRALRTEE